MRKLPQSGEKWRHFKGGEYSVIAIAYFFKAREKKRVVYSKAAPEWNTMLAAKVFDTESNAVFSLHQFGSLEPNYALFFLSPTEETWKSENVTDGTIWARPLDNFMEVVGEDPCCEYRFERIAEAQ